MDMSSWSWLHRIALVLVYGINFITSGNKFECSCMGAAATMSVLETMAPTAAAMLSPSTGAANLQDLHDQIRVLVCSMV